MKKQQMRMAAFLVAVTLALSGLAMAQYRDGDDDRDDGYYRQGNWGQASQYGYQSGYRDGVEKGRHEGRENDPNDYRTPDWRQATRGYQSWMGSVGAYQSGYRNGYQNGFREGFNSAYRRGDGDGDRDDIRPVYDGGGDPWGGGRFGNQAYDFGYQDGATAGRGDRYEHKPFNPTPRGRYEDADRGYNRAYGDINAYRRQYASGYRAGYQSSYGRY
jgi:hypothetical protein